MYMHVVLVRVKHRCFWKYGMVWYGMVWYGNLIYTQCFL